MYTSFMIARLILGWEFRERTKTMEHLVVYRTVEVEVEANTTNSASYANFNNSTGNDPGL